MDDRNEQVYTCLIRGLFEAALESLFHLSTSPIFLPPSFSLTRSGPTFLIWKHHLSPSISRHVSRMASFHRLSITVVDPLGELREIAGNVGRVPIEDWDVADANLTAMFEDDDLGVKGVAD